MSTNDIAGGKGLVIQIASWLTVSPPHILSNSSSHAGVNLYIDKENLHTRNDLGLN